MKQQIEVIVNSKGLDSKIKLCGFQSDPMKYIRGADVLILPSLIEGLPGVVLEAFYCKIPVVANDVGGIKEIVINNQTGRLIKKGDEDAFVKGILEALKTSPQNQKLIENAYTLVTSQYLNTQIANQFLNIYKSFAF